MHRPALPYSHPVTLIATWFGSGLVRPAPGTWGSLAALPFAFGLAWLGGPWLLLLAAAGAFALGIWAAQGYAQASSENDPAEVVIDEVAGQWLSLVPIALDPLLYPLGFLAFRLFDIAKPWPVGWLDRKVKGGLGIMADDMAAGIYAGLVCWLAKMWWFAGG